MAGSDFKTWARSQKAPVNLTIMGLLIACALLFWFTAAKGIENFMLGADSHQRPWSFFTYAFAEMPFASGLSLMFFVFMLLWLYSFGGTVEREMGSARYAAFFAIATVVMGLVLWGGLNLVTVNRLVGAAFLPILMVTQVWCARNMTSTIMIYGLIPVSGKWLAVLNVIIVILLYGLGAPLLGVIAAVPLVLAFFFGAERIPGLNYRGVPKQVQATRAQARYDDKYYDDVRKREKEREERERLRKLFEGSLKDDDAR